MPAQRRRDEPPRRARALIDIVAEERIGVAVGGPNTGDKIEFECLCCWKRFPEYGQLRTHAKQCR